MPTITAAQAARLEQLERQLRDLEEFNARFDTASPAADAAQKAVDDWLAVHRAELNELLKARGEG